MRVSAMVGEAQQPGKHRLDVAETGAAVPRVFVVRTEEMKPDRDIMRGRMEQVGMTRAAIDGRP
jgi:hypothetical protein